MKSSSGARMQTTAFFFKQWGAWGKDNKRRSKKANGRIYRERVWDDMPKAAMKPRGLGAPAQ